MINSSSDSILMGPGGFQPIIDLGALKKQALDNHAACKQEAHEREAYCSGDAPYKFIKLEFSRLDFQTDVVIGALDLHRHYLFSTHKLAFEDDMLSLATY